MALDGRGEARHAKESGDMQKEELYRSNVAQSNTTALEVAQPR